MIDKDTIVATAIQAAGITEFEYYNRRTDYSVMAKMCCYTYCYGKDMTHTAIAEYFGAKRVTVTQTINKFHGRYKYDDRFRIVYDKFIALIKGLEQ